MQTIIKTIIPTDDMLFLPFLDDSLLSSFTTSVKSVKFVRFWLVESDADVGGASIKQTRRFLKQEEYNYYLIILF